MSNYHKYKKDNSWNPAKCACKNGKYSRGVIDNSIDIYNEIIETTK